nr:DUF2332 family protein [uncultured Gellertiella sp.]
MQDRIRDSFTKQAVECDRLDAPFMGRLLRLLANSLNENSRVGAAILNWPGNPLPGGDALALRVAGALHALVLDGNRDLGDVYPPHQADEAEIAAACERALQSHAEFILARLASPPQTNEVRRSGPLYAGLLEIARQTGKPLRLLEIGASAGLNLIPDHYGYRFDGIAFGNAEAPVQIAPDWQGPRPPSVRLAISGRGGCDLNPLSSTEKADRDRLLSYLWAGQTDRLQRTRAALGLAARIGAPVERADALPWLDARLGDRRKGEVRVILHSVVWQYFPDSLKAQMQAMISRHAADADEDHPIAWLSMEGDGKPEGAAVSLTLWPGGETRELGRADYHGRWLRWTGWQ